MKAVLPIFIALASGLAFSPAQASETKPSAPTVTSAYVNPLYFFRQNDRLTYVTMVKFDNGSSVERWNTVDCENKKYYKLYWDLLGKEGDHRARYYGTKGFERYAPAQETAELGADMIAKMCDIKIRNSDWVYSEKKNTEGKDIKEASSLVDIANIVKINDKLVVRLGYGYEEIGYDPPYDAPFDLKVEYHIYDCKAGKDTVIGATDVDSQGFVTDSLIGEAMKKRASGFTNSEKVVAALKTLCSMSDPQQYRGEGKYQTHQGKSVAKYSGPNMPDFSNNNPTWINRFPLNAGVEEKGIALIKTWAEPRFKQLKWTETQAGDKAVNMVADVQSNGLVRRLEDYNMFTAQRILVANDIQLKGAMSISYSPSITQKLDTTLRFPLSQGQQYHELTESAGQDEGNVSRIERRCRVTGSDEASKINSAFTGTYWRVECDEFSKEGPEKTVKAWLNDLRIFLPMDRIYNGKSQHVQITGVHITR
ncbi:hypothetical protein HV346_11505 [Enterobacter sp. RHBSTW-00994]|uniref:hypothetical protein n=1 Tax=Enterobacteriaceae TaxID=543 RepID=UPI0015EAC7C7|nr:MULTISPECIES: hypothetical protein [Enterobacteriaceae]MBM3070449.1 hypothetical protein [Lelliottia sp. RWM.1]QLR43267.1 hypothetical protein HV346_11505 [Enterobacter sp. RHBSTW-00994]